MKLIEAKSIIDQIANKTLGSLISEDKFSDIVVNKGKTGQLLENVILNLNLSSTLHDFEDGELKTNKCKANGEPEETIAITQISQIIDSLIMAEPFENSRLALKIKNLLYVPIYKGTKTAPEDSHNWYFMKSIHIDFTDTKFADIWKQIEQDYYIICAEIKTKIDTVGTISTTNGKYIQIRTKDSAPYHPIYSNIYDKQISNKNYAFYFKKDFIKAISTIK